MPERGGCGWPKHKHNSRCAQIHRAHHYDVDMVAEQKVRSSARTQPERRTATSSRVASQKRRSRGAYRGTTRSSTRPRKLVRCGNLSLQIRVRVSRKPSWSPKRSKEAETAQERIPERIAEQIAARTCRKEQTVEAMKMFPQERVSKRIVKQIMACHKWQEQNVEGSQNHATSCEHEGPIEDCASRQDPAADR